jgi:Flp pilus assembly protein TadG
MGRAVVLSRHDGARSAGEVDGPCRRERGATLVEAAIITPLFFLLIFGIIEVGGAYKDKLAIGNAVTAGARTGSASADDALADYNILIAVEKALAAADRSAIEYIVVFNAGSADGVPTPGCKAGSSYPGLDPTGARTGACNVYTTAAFDEDQSHFGCKTAYTLDKYYCPSSRKVVLTAANGGPPDVVGVWIKMHHAYYTKFIADSVTLTDQAVIAVEPRRL